ncbi:nicotinamide mononucleotide transporter [Apilactobacillus bombintestini]|uniref:nicotinamide mononucleotide transporter n=1 Tax=Apilactobacillus bombintestini TaxID=2419772 RepID=UPI001F5C01C6|nr:nicotinamide mononucleotide transporter [Apilactobacillus bombintestini]
MNKILRNLATSKTMDLLGIAIIFFTALMSGYLFETLNDVTSWGRWAVFIPFGFISAIDACMSIMSTRLVGRFSNLGNWVGVPEIILGCIIDFLLGNHGAILTYPISFVIQIWAIKTWTRSDKFKKSNLLDTKNGKYIISLLVTLAIIFSFIINYIGYEHITSSNMTLYVLTSLVFGISLIANIMNAVKISTQWKFWLLYDFIQLAKAISQLNFANVGKYIYYIIMALAGNAYWK